MPHNLMNEQNPKRSNIDPLKHVIPTTKNS